jgi:hypothetical protein
MTKSQLNDKLDCQRCGTIQMAVSEDAVDETPVHCRNCGRYLGTWGELQRHFARQIGSADSIDLDRGTMTKNL